MDPTLVRARELVVAGGLPAPDDVDCVCGAPRDGHSGASRGGACAETGCRRYRPEPVQHLAARAEAARDSTFRGDLAESSRRQRARTRRKRPGSVNVRPSDRGACRRAVWYREVGPEEDFELAPSDRGPAYIGTLIHDSFLARRARLYPWRMYGDKRGNALVLPGFERESKYDEYDPLTGEVTDVKTAGRYRWDDVNDAGFDPKWWEQDLLYGLALELAGYPVETIAVLVIDRADGKDAFERRPYDREAAMRILLEQQALAMALEAGVVPPRDRSGPTTDGICRNCPFRRHCWNMDEAEAQGRSPENLTVIGDDYEDEQIAALVEHLVAKRQEAKDATDVVDELKALLDGVDLRPYGDYGPQLGTSVTTRWKDWAEEVRTLWPLPDAQRPDELPEPVVDRKKTVTWKKLSIAARKKLAKLREERLLALEGPKPEEAPEEPTGPLLVPSTRITRPEALIPLELETADSTS